MSDSRRVRAWNVKPGAVLPWLNTKTRREVRYTVVENDQTSFPGVVQLRLRGAKGEPYHWNVKPNSLVVVRVES